MFDTPAELQAWRSAIDAIYDELLRDLREHFQRGAEDLAQLLQHQVGLDWMLERDAAQGFEGENDLPYPAVWPA